MNVTIIGLGYVGLVNAVVFASYNHDVIGFDVDKEKVSLLKQGISPIDEDGVQILLSEAKHKIRFTTNAKDAIRPNNLISIAVDTPPDEEGNIDMKNFNNAVELIAENAAQDSIVCIHSTVPPGTNRKVKQYLESHSKYKFEVVSLPMFLREGTALRDFVSPSRIIIGTDSPKVEKEIRSVVESFLVKKVPIMVTTPENAEVIKCASNTYLAMRVSFINEIARICEYSGADIDKVSLGISLDPRIGLSYFKPSVGYGGTLFPKDSLVPKGDNAPIGEQLVLSRAVIESNKKQIQFFIDKIFKRFKSITNFKVAVLGLAYKGDTEDVRNSPAVKVIRALLDKYAEIYAYDPLAEDNFKKLFVRHTHIHYLDYAKDALTKADFVVILNDSNEFKNLTVDDFKVMKHMVIFDGKNLYKPENMRGAEYHSVGRPTVGLKK